MNPDQQLDAVRNSLGLEKFRRHIFLCADQTEPKCCARETGLASWEFLKRRLKELNLVGAEPLVYRTKANCLRVCTRGPIAVPDCATQRTGARAAAPRVAHRRAPLLTHAPPHQSAARWRRVNGR